mmetsp:Transcript_32106/g.41152  ORF Transcript_32106/g.41152 Transcript_32106/m.41152 type:complete len:400 (+) Transcript_32106:176-1375(+)|eukprot:CAMPEP_0117752698 /NCGR_PEP_ID=MMETSP0947-20121206/11775_1 /TAXON_ID=44440 /ORGANISM="Chattonella subsalsa, Strain CCMP2191" /LENGTH=399 /DNA_ID=CAMNT_0005571419 /DNA_START=162 /DNA_END=1361 /DNA_ORIENTATION=-
MPAKQLKRAMLMAFFVVALFVIQAHGMGSPSSNDMNLFSSKVSNETAKRIHGINGGALASKPPKLIQKSSSSSAEEGKNISVKKASPGKVLTLFGVWYLLTICSSTAMTSASKSLPLPWIGTCMRMWVGAVFVYFTGKTGLRPMPSLAKSTIKSVIPVAFLSTTTLLFTGMAYAAGSLAFVSIVKSAEPVTMAILNAIIFQKLLPFPVYASLLPVVFGVGLASLKELNFSLASLIYAMIVNCTSSLRSILAKNLTSTGLTSQALTGLVQILGAFMITPIAACLESGKLIKIIQSMSEDAAVAASMKRFLMLNVLSGICLLLFYEGNFRCLSAVGPLSHSIGSTIGRVVVITAGVLIYKTQMTPLNILGAVLSVGGVFLYSFMQNYYAKKAVAQTTESSN